nr:type II toxin-antitoxin system VapC family toxin [Thermus arciformis]
MDTSLLVRYLTGDPPHLAERAAQVLDGEETLGITEVALVETAYVLESVYGVPRREVVDALLALLQKENLKAVGGDKDLWMRALLLCRPSRRVSFGDALIWAAVLASGVRQVYILDARFPREESRSGRNMGPWLEPGSEPSFWPSSPCSFPPATPSSPFFPSPSPLRLRWWGKATRPSPPGKRPPTPCASPSGRGRAPSPCGWPSPTPAPRAPRPALAGTQAATPGWSTRGAPSP